MKALEHPLTIATATGATLLSFLKVYNVAMESFVVTVSAALVLNKAWKTFGPRLCRAWDRWGSR